MSTCYICDELATIIIDKINLCEQCKINYYNERVKQFSKYQLQMRLAMQFYVRTQRHEYQIRKRQTNLFPEDK